MYTIFWPRRRWMSRFDAINALEGVIKTRGNWARGVVETVGRLVTIHEPVKRM